MGSLEKSVFWRRSSISLVQLKRAALHNLRWIASLTPHALAGLLNCKYPADCSLERPANRCGYNNVARKHRHAVSTNRITPLSRIHPSYPPATLHYIQSQHRYRRNSPSPSKMAFRQTYSSTPDRTSAFIVPWGPTVMVPFLRTQLRSCPARQRGIKSLVYVLASRLPHEICLLCSRQGTTYSLPSDGNFTPKCPPRKTKSRSFC